MSVSPPSMVEPTSTTRTFLEMILARNTGGAGGGIYFSDSGERIAVCSQARDIARGREVVAPHNTPEAATPPPPPPFAWHRPSNGALSRETRMFLERASAAQRRGVFYHIAEIAAMGEQR